MNQAMKIIGAFLAGCLMVTLLSRGVFKDFEHQTTATKHVTDSLVTAWSRERDSLVLVSKSALDSMDFYKSRRGKHETEVAAVKTSTREKLTKSETYTNHEKTVAADRAADNFSSRKNTRLVIH